MRALRQQIWQWRGVLIVPEVARLLILLRLAGLLQSLELWALDQPFCLRPSEPRDSRVVIVGINDLDLDKIGEWHIPDGVLAQWSCPKEVWDK